MFTAGLPGAGKTEFTKNFIEASESNAIRLDMDEIAAKIEGYRPEIADLYRKSATTLLNEVFNTVLKRKLDFIMDGTFGSPYAIKNIERVLRHGYSVRVVYVVQNPKIAWKFTQAREKIEHRAINIDGFVSTYFKVQENIKQILALKCDKIELDIAIKNTDNTLIDFQKDVTIKEIEKIIGEKFTNETLKEYIND